MMKLRLDNNIIFQSEINLRYDTKFIQQSAPSFYDPQEWKTWQNDKLKEERKSNGGKPIIDYGWQN